MSATQLHTLILPLGLALAVLIDRTRNQPKDPR